MVVKPLRIDVGTLRVKWYENYDWCYI